MPADKQRWRGYKELKTRNGHQFLGTGDDACKSISVDSVDSLIESV